MPIDFSQLSDVEAAAFLERWAAGFDDRLAWLEQIAGPAHPLDRSRASLVRLWKWYLDGRPFSGGDPPAWVAEHDATYVPPGDLPVIDALATYLAATLQTNFAELELVVGQVPGMRRYVHRQKPVLRLPDGWEIDPIQKVFARAATADEGRDDEALAFFYDRTEERRGLR